MKLQDKLVETVGLELEAIVVNGLYPERFSTEETARLRELASRDGRPPGGARAPAPRSLAGPGSLSVSASCGDDGDSSVSTTTDEAGIIQGFAHGIGEGRDDWEGRDDSFTPG